MDIKMQLTYNDLQILSSSLEETINVLKNRFEQDDKYVHPAKKYEDLCYKLNNWLEPQEGSLYFISPVIKTYFLEAIDPRGGLLVKIITNYIDTCTYSVKNAMQFSTKLEAENFAMQNDLVFKYKILDIEC